MKQECDRCNLEFSCTAFCKWSAEIIAPYVKSFKIGSLEVPDMDFIKNVAAYGKPLILSCGKVTYEQLDRIFDVVDNEIILLYCVVKYPCSPDEVDLSEMDRLRKRYHCKVGFSDHTKSISKAIEAADKGAYLIEKHFMLEDGNAIDAAVSLTPSDFLKMTRRIKGNG